MEKVSITDEDILKTLENISNEKNCEKFNELYTKLYKTDNFEPIKKLIEKKNIPENSKETREEYNEFPNDDELERILRISEEEYEIELERRIQEDILMNNNIPNRDGEYQIK